MLILNYKEINKKLKLILIFLFEQKIFLNKGYS